MMFDVEEHVEGDASLDPAPDGSSNVMIAIAVVMDRPHREECRQALADRHRRDVVAQDRRINDEECGGNDGNICR